VGQAHDTGKDVAEGRSLPRPLLPATVGPAPQKPTSRQGRANKARVNTQPRFRALYRCLDAELVLVCWQDLNHEAASGGDHVPAEAYGAKLHANIEALVQRLQAQRYRAKLVRRCYLPQENGKVSPRGMPALADKLGPRACAKLWRAIYAQDLLDCSDGYRPGRGALEAVSGLTCDRPYGTSGSGVEVDGKGVFDPLDHTWLEAMLRVRSADRAFLRLIRQWLQAGILDTEGHVMHPETGTTHGGTVSPVLANAYWP